MTIKGFIFLLLGLLILGILISLIYGFLINFNSSTNNIDKDNANLQLLYSTCSQKRTTYNNVKTQQNLIDLCCYKYDINKDNDYSLNEYCKGLKEYKSVCISVNCNI